MQVYIIYIYINFEREGWEIDALWLARPLLLVIWCSHVVHICTYMYLSLESTVATVLEHTSSATLYVQEQFKCKCIHSVHVHCLLVYMYTSTQMLVHQCTCNNM